MEIAVVANMRLPTEKAHGYQTMRMCEAWATQGHAVTLYVPRRPNNLAEDAFSYYGVKPLFKLVYIDCFQWIRFAKILRQAAFFLQSYSFLRALGRSVHFGKNAVVLSRNPEVVRYPEPGTESGHLILADAVVCTQVSRQLVPGLARNSVQYRPTSLV